MTGLNNGQKSVFSASSSLQPTLNDILQQNLDVLVPVGPTVLMVEAQGVKQLVLDRSIVNAALTTQGHCLTVALSAHIGVASAEMLDRTVSSSEVVHPSFGTVSNIDAFSLNVVLDRIGINIWE